MTEQHNSSETQGFQFPCDYQIKAMGQDDGDFRNTVIEIIGRHCEIDPDRVTCRSSANGKYLSVSVIIEAHSREHLNTIYDALTADEKVLMRL